MASLVISGCAAASPPLDAPEARLRQLPEIASTPPSTVRPPIALPLDPCRGDEPPSAVPLPAPVTFGSFWQALDDQIERLDASALRERFVAFAEAHGADTSSPALWRDFVRLWLAFEATRDGGFWRLRWSITDREPSSVEIWKAWRAQPLAHEFARATAVAECDEITALYAITARRLGVRGVGLFYPTWNHVIAGWSPPPESGVQGIVLIPTTQIFQGCESTFDDTSFRPPRHVYEFPRRDVRDEQSLPGDLAEHLLEQVRAYGEARPELLALIRAKRATLLRSSLGDCDDYRERLAAQLAGSLTCADRRALRHLAVRELARPELGVAEVMAFLAEK